MSALHETKQRYAQRFVICSKNKFISKNEVKMALFLVKGTQCLSCGSVSVMLRKLGWKLLAFAAPNKRFASYIGRSVLLLAAHVKGLKPISMICCTGVDEWKTNLMSLAILFHLLRAQHVSDINISIFRSLWLCWWFTTSVVLFCKDGCFSVSVTLRCVVVCVWCDVFCRFVVVGRRFLIDFDRYLLCLVTIVFVISSWSFIRQLLQWCTVQ